MLFNINEERLKDDIATLSKMIDKSYPGYTRRPFTKYYKESRGWLYREMEALGLEVYIDAASNLIGKRTGKVPSLAPIMIGSHTDSVIGGGRFDGIIGVLAGIEIVRQLNELDIELNHTLLIVDFTAEEASEFGISTIGSRGMVGMLTEEQLSRDNLEGLKLEKGISLIGGRPENIQNEALQKGDLSLYMELHIEQGPVLDKTGNDIGAVTGIVGIRRYKVVTKGQPNHAGTTPMNMRYDALSAASEVILSIEKVANQNYEEPAVGTVGRIFSKPNGSNIIPGEIILEFELRSISDDVLDQMVQFIKEHIQSIKNKRDIHIEIQELSYSDPVKINFNILHGIRESCKVIGKTIDLPSGAGHDANQIAKIAPVGMIFVPSKNGKSHCPEEWTEYRQVAKGVHALANALIYFDTNL